MHGNTISLSRGLLRVDEPGPRMQHMTDDDVVDKLQTYSPLTMVVLDKLALFVRVVKNKSLTLLLILINGSGAKGSWVDGIHAILCR